MWYAGVPVAAVIWWLLYTQLIPISEWVTSLFPVARDSHTGEAITYFVYDVPKVLLLLTGIVFVTGVLRSWFSPEKTRAILAGKRQVWGYPLASALGVLTPFCSCSSVPLFIGFVSAGIPLGVTFSFLIAGPMVGPVGLGLLYGLVGWQVATIYLVFGFTIATVAGFVLGRVGLERYLQDWVRELNAGTVVDLLEERLTLVDRLKIGVEQVREIVGKVRIRTLAAWRPDLTAYREVGEAYHISLKSLARRYPELHDEIADLDDMIEAIVKDLAPELLVQTAIGLNSAAQLLLTAGDNPERLKSEASVAALCGVSPVPASSGKTVRHRLNRGGDRAANSAIHIIAIGRLRLDPRTQAYVAKRIAAGNSKLEAIRSLKRYIAREVFGIIMRRHKQINQMQIAA